MVKPAMSDSGVVLLETVACRRSMEMEERPARGGLAEWASECSGEAAKRHEQARRGAQGGEGGEGGHVVCPSGAAVSAIHGWCHLDAARPFGGAISSSSSSFFLRCYY